MDAVQTLLDRELHLSAVLHDLRGALTAAQGWAELEEEEGPLPRVLARIGALVEAAGDPVSPPESAELEGRAIRIVAPIDILKRAIDGLQHEDRVARDEGGEVVLEIRGVPAEEASGGWTLAQVHAWLADGGPGLAGARLQVAARRVGATRCTFSPAGDGRHVTATIRLPRG